MRNVCEIKIKLINYTSERDAHLTALQLVSHKKILASTSASERSSSSLYHTIAAAAALESMAHNFPILSNNMHINDRIHLSRLEWVVRARGPRNTKWFIFQIKVLKILIIFLFSVHSRIFLSLTSFVCNVCAIFLMTKDQLAVVLCLSDCPWITFIIVSK
jgi:hypothetical protein